MLIDDKMIFIKKNWAKLSKVGHFELSDQQICHKSSPHKPTSAINGRIRTQNQAIVFNLEG